MNNWLIFALLPPILWGFTNVLDSALRKNFIKSDFALTWFVAFTRLPFVILFFLISGFYIPDITSVLLMLIGGILWTYPPMILYFKAMETEDASRISLLMQLVPVFTLLIAFFALGEVLTINQGLAFVILIIGGIFASLKKTEKNWHFSKAFLLIGIAGFLWATSDVLFKKLETVFPDFLSAFAFFFLGSFLASMFMLMHADGRSKVLNHFTILSKRGWIMIIATQTLGIIGSISFAYALTLGKASLTAVMIGIQPLFALGFGLILAQFIKEIHREDLSKKTLLLKGLSFVLIIVGLVVLEIA